MVLVREIKVFLMPRRAWAVSMASKEQPRSARGAFDPRESESFGFLATASTAARAHGVHGGAGGAPTRQLCCSSRAAGFALSAIILLSLLVSGKSQLGCPSRVWN